MIPTAPPRSCWRWSLLRAVGFRGCAVPALTAVASRSLRSAEEERVRAAPGTEGGGVATEKAIPGTHGPRHAHI